MKWFDRWFLRGMGYIESELGWRFGTIMLMWELEGLANYPDAVIDIDAEQIAWTGFSGSQLTGIVRGIGGTGPPHSYLLENSD